MGFLRVCSERAAKQPTGAGEGVGRVFWGIQGKTSPPPPLCASVSPLPPPTSDAHLTGPRRGCGAAGRYPGVTQRRERRVDPLLQSLIESRGRAGQSRRFLIYLFIYFYGLHRWSLHSLYGCGCPTESSGVGIPIYPGSAPGGQPRTPRHRCGDAKGGEFQEKKQNPVPSGRGCPPPAERVPVTAKGGEDGAALPLARPARPSGVGSGGISPTGPSALNEPEPPAAPREQPLLCQFCLIKRQSLSSKLTLAKKKKKSMFSHRRKYLQTSAFFLRAVNNTARGSSGTACLIDAPA